MAYDARIVANYFLDLANRDRILLSPLKLQKLVYLAHGWSLALRGKPLIRQNVEAWRYGPVIPELYQAFKNFGGSVISNKAVIREQAEQIDEDSQKLIGAVWEKYKNLSALQLSALTHEPGSAWDLVMNNPSFFGRPTINDDLIADEFQRRRQRR